MYVGIDIGGSKIRVGVADNPSELLRSQKIASPPDSQTAIAEMTRLIHEQSNGETISAIAIASPGPLDRANGTVNPVNLPWGNTHLVESLKAEFNVPTVLENDANAAALGEATIGAGKGLDPVLYVTISTGIGTGLVTQGNIYHGAYDTEGGHIIIQPGGPKCGCGGKGHFEAIVSGTAIKARFGKIARDITDPEIWDQIAADIAIGIANMVTLLSPQVVVLGGGVGVHFDKFIAPLNKHLKVLSLPYPLPKIVQAKYTETAAIYGCFILAEQITR